MRHELFYGRDGQPSTPKLADAVEMWEHDPDISMDGYPIIELVWRESPNGNYWDWDAGMWHDVAPWELRTGEWPTYMAAIGDIWRWRHG